MKKAFVPERLINGSNRLLSTFYDGEQQTSDPRHRAHFRVSAELMGRTIHIHIFKREYISQDDERKISEELDAYVKTITNSHLGIALTEAAEVVAEQ
jgi:hypothetical protein